MWRGETDHIVLKRRADQLAIGIEPDISKALVVFEAKIVSSDRLCGHVGNVCELLSFRGEHFHCTGEALHA